MKQLTVIIIDDEPLAINVLKNYVAKVDSLTLVHTFSNAIEASAYLRYTDVDIIFLDIDMPILNGLSFLQNLKKIPFVVITTAHDEYALKGFELEVIDYLVKPIPFPRFLKSVNRILALKENTAQMASKTSEKPSIFVKVNKKRLQKVYLDEIMIIESLKDYIRIITTTGKYIIHRTLSGFTEELPADKFIRIHRSYTVAIDKVDVVEGNSLEVGGIRYTIGRSYLTETKKAILNDISEA